MAPQRARKRKSTASTTTLQVEERQATNPETTQSSTHVSADPMSAMIAAETPRRSPAKQLRPVLSMAQKQALIDNLQLEITERARKLRAQYHLQAQGLKTRLEIRIHRIPAALRKTKITDLLEQFSQESHPSLQKTAVNKVLASSTVADDGTSNVTQKGGATSLLAGASRGAKRPSHLLADEAGEEDGSVENPKKRTKTVVKHPAAASSATNRTVSRRDHPSQVLSPKSDNSRPIARSPVKGSAIPSPMKNTFARPVSPLKPSGAASHVASSAVKSTTVSKVKSAAVRNTSRQATAKGNKTASTKPTRAVAASAASTALSNVDNGRTSSASDATDGSAGTTIVTKRTTSRAAPSAARKVTKPTAAGKFAGVSAAGRKVAPAKAEPPSTGRTLRKRA